MVNKFTEVEAARSVTEQLEDLIQGSKPASPIEGRIERGDIISDSNEMGPMAISELKKAGRTVCYDIRDGRTFPVNDNMLAAQLKKLDPATGKRWATTTDPGYRPKRGAFVCWLHGESERRAEADAFGFSVCQRSGVHTQYDLERHMRGYHPQEFNAFNQDAQRKREDERDLVNRQLLERAMCQAPATVQSVAAPVATTNGVDTTVGSLENPSGVGVSETCECGEILDAKTAGGMVQKRRHHRNRSDKHPEQTR